jgi:hypothetical protein
MFFRGNRVFTNYRGMISASLKHGSRFRHYDSDTASAKCGTRYAELKLSDSLRHINVTPVLQCTQRHALALMLQQYKSDTAFSKEILSGKAQDHARPSHVRPSALLPGPPTCTFALKVPLRRLHPPTNQNPSGY